MSGDWIAAACAFVCVVAGLALALARTRMALSLAFTFVAVFAGLAAIAAGAFDTGLVLVVAGAMIALFTMASAAGVGEVADFVSRRPALVPLAASVLCAGALCLAWPGAPPAPALASPPRVIAFETARGMDIFIALIAFVAVGAGVTALVGFGARGVFGADKDGVS
jgi:hypothetical protein